MKTNNKTQTTYETFPYEKKIILIDARGRLLVPKTDEWNKPNCSLIVSSMMSLNNNNEKLERKCADQHV